MDLNPLLALGKCERTYKDVMLETHYLHFDHREELDMTPHDAIMATANLFEQRPELYDFQNIRVPPCGSPGCALGYIGHFVGIETERFVSETARKVLGLKYSRDFYDRMHWLAGGHWNDNAFTCAAALRLYAKKFLQPTHTGIPASVAEIFEREGAKA